MLPYYRQPKGNNAVLITNTVSGYDAAANH